MTYNARAEYEARMKKVAEQAQTTASQESAEAELNSGSKAEVDATKDNEKNGGTEEIASDVTGNTSASQEEVTKLPEGESPAENVAEVDSKPNEISTTDAEVPTDAEDAPESPVEPYNTSESPESLAKGVVSEIKKVETGVTQVINDDRAIGELENIAQEMRELIATKGAMTSAESAMFSVAVQNTLRGVDGALDTLDMPSMENFHNPTTSAYATEVSLEGVIDQISALIDKAATRVGQGFKNVVGLANSLTPYLNRMKKRAEAVRGNVNGSNREDGLKTVSGNFVSALQLDGSVPNADTVVKTSEYLSRVTSEVFGSKAWVIGEQYGKLANLAVSEMAAETNFSKGGPSIWWPILFGYLGLAVYAAKDGIAASQTTKEMKVDATKFPSLISAFPTVAKVNHAFDDSEQSANLDGKRSFPLFGNKAIVVSDFKSKVQANIKQGNFPKLTLIDLVGDKSAAAKEIQTLTSKQQSQVINNTITTLDGLIDYYKSFAQRSAAMARVYDNAFAAGLKAKDSNKKHNRYIPIAIQRLATEFMDGILGQQGKIAKQFGTSTGALIDYVEKSRAATQADDSDAAKAAANKAEAESA